MAFGYYAASVLCPAREPARVPLPGSAVSEFPSSAWTCSRNPSLACLTPGVWWETSHGSGNREAHLPHSRLVKCFSRFHLFGRTTLQTQVPFGSLGRRGRPCPCFGSQMLVHWKLASHASGVPLLNACRIPLASFSKWAFSG